MRKEVKRSLIIWPTIASTAMIGMSCISMMKRPSVHPIVKADIALSIAGSSWHGVTSKAVNATAEFGEFGTARRFADGLNHAEVLTDDHPMGLSDGPTYSAIRDDSDLFANVERLRDIAASSDAGGWDVVERDDHGSRAMKLPERLETVFEMPSQVLIPVVEPVIAPPARTSIETRSETSFAQSLELDAPLPVAPSAANNGSPPRIDSPIVVKPSTIDVRRNLVGVTNRVPSTTAVPLGFDRRAEIALELPMELDGPVPTAKRKSVLPDSISVLAKVVPVINEPEAESTETDTVDSIAAEASVATAETSPQSPLTLNQSDTPDTPQSRGQDSEVESIVNSLSLSRPRAKATQDFVAESIQQRAEAAVAQTRTRDERTANETTAIGALGSPATWPAATSLSEKLSTLINAADSTSRPGETWVTAEKGDTETRVEPTSAEWSRQVAKTLASLQSLNRLGDDRAGTLVEQLANLADEGRRQAEELSDDAARVRWLNAAFAVSRRAAVWKPVWEVARGTSGYDSDQPSESFLASPRPNDDAVRTLLSAVKQELRETGDRDGWVAFLLISELEAAVDAPARETRAEAARRFLSRLRHHSLHPSHVRWLEQSKVSLLAEAVRPWTNNAIDYANLLSEIERQETDSLERSATDIASAIQTLRYAKNEKLTNVASAIDTHYRNANLRVAITAKMLTRLLPTMQPQTIPIRTTVMGSQVRGNSRVESDLKLQLNPASDRWSVSLRTLGNVHTRSVGFSGPVAVQTQGQSSFVAATPIDITGRDILIGDPRVQVQGHTNLRGVQSKYDQVPLVNRLVRGIAQSRYQSIAPQSNQIANRMMRTQIAETIDKVLEERVAKATERLSESVIGPLGRMQLDPQVIDMQTTNERLLARYRLAGESQLAAFTPRPRAPTESLMSVQVHQSAINNTLEQLIPTGSERSVQQTIVDALDVLGAANASLPDDLPDDVTIQFSKTRPVTVEIKDGQLWIAMRIVRLNRGDKLKLSRFIVRAAYRPEIDGINIGLVRDGHLRISGAGMSMRERLPVRAIFNKVLSPTRKLPLTLPQIAEHTALDGLVITQLEMRDGWIGVAVGPEDSPRLALAATASR